MKKVLLLLALLAVLVALVACGGEKTPNDDTPKVTTKAPTTQAPKYIVKFMDSELFLDEDGKQVEFSSKEIKRGDFARAPRDPYHEGYVFLGWDVDDYSYITSDMTITAMYRPIDTYKVEFYDGETLLGTVDVNEGEEVIAPTIPLKVGYVFSAWDKPVARVDREWEDFAAYADLSEEELASTEMVFKTKATYIEADGVIDYYDDIKFELKETTADGKKTYVPANVDYFKNSIHYVELNPKNVYVEGDTSKIAPDDNYNMADTDIALAWDGEYIYMYVTVCDPTLMTRGRDYCASENPYINDVFEFWYSAQKMPHDEIVKVFMLDFYGYDMGSDSEAKMSKYFADIEYKCEVVEDTNTSYMFFKFPAKNEDGEAFVAGDVFYYAVQIDDLRFFDSESSYLLRCSYSNRSAYNEYEKLTFGEKK